MPLHGAAHASTALCTARTNIASHCFQKTSTEPRRGQCPSAVRNPHGLSIVSRPCIYRQLRPETTLPDGNPNHSHRRSCTSRRVWQRAPLHSLLRTSRKNSPLPGGTSRCPPLYYSLIPCMVLRNSFFYCLCYSLPPGSSISEHLTLFAWPMIATCSLRSISTTLRVFPLYRISLPTLTFSSKSFIVIASKFDIRRTYVRKPVYVG